MPEGAAKFHTVFQTVFNDHAESPAVLDYGWVDAEGLHTHTFPKVVPHGRFGWLKVGTLRPTLDTVMDTTPTVSGSDAEHIHTITLPEQMNMPVDNELLIVAWIGAYAVVLGGVLQDFVTPA